jgi:rhodanese-related sulfurtransferase
MARAVRYHFAFPAHRISLSMSFIQANWLLILVMLASGAMLVWPLVQRRISPGRDVGNLDATRLINSSNAVLVDVRETKEYDGGRLPGAIHIPLSQLAGRGDELARVKGRPVIVYCMSGNRSRMANAALARLGFKDVYNLQGGYRAWKDAGLPVEK